MRITRLAATFSALTMALAVAACGGDDAGSGDTAAKGIVGKASSQKKLTIGVKADQPGLGLQTGSTYTGFDIEIAKIIAKGLGVDESGITWKTTVSSNREPYIQQGQVDLVVATYTINDDRKKVVNFAGPYFVAGQDLLVPAASTITGPDDLAGKKVCSVTGSTPAEQIKPYLASPSQLVQFDVYDKCANALRTGQVQVVTTDNVILLGFVSKSDNTFKLVGEQFTKEPYGIGIKKGDVKFCEFVNKTLKDNAPAYMKAWADTAGKVEGAAPASLPTPSACV